MNIIRVFSFILFYLPLTSASAQEITGRILDMETKQPIPYASVIYAEQKGVMTNEEGRFSLISNEAIAQVSISSMGYETLELNPSEVQRDIFLKPLSIQLQEVFLTDEQLTGREILEKVKESLAENYNFELTRNRFFFRESELGTVNRFDLEVEESTIEGIDQQLLNDISNNIPKQMGAYKEVLGDFYGNYQEQKLQIAKAANLENPSSTERLDELTEEMELLFRQSLKEHSFLKVRSGLIGVKVDAEELEEEVKDSPELIVKTPEELEKEAVMKKQSLSKNVNREIAQLLNSMFWKEGSDFDVFEKSRKYEFEVEGFTLLDNETVYVLAFEPKRGADFKGKIYVNTLDYGVHRLDYENVKPLSRFRLFGLSTVKDVYGGKMIFAKNGDGKYQPKYIEQQRGESFGLTRPLTIVEKNRVVPGRNKQNELDLELDLSFSQVNTLQFVVYETLPLDTTTFAGVEEVQDFQFETFKAYNPEYWTGSNIIEPNEAIQKFTTLEGR